jgi:hypothetical protein
MIILRWAEPGGDNTDATALIIAVAAGDHATAVAAYADATVRWRWFGDVPELAFALVGQGRCLIALGAPGADDPLREARALLTTMGFAPVLSETDALLQRTGW